jgi:hypothetical protein
MNFYNIGRTNEIDVIGFYPQTKLADLYNLEANDSFRKVLFDSFPDFQPKYGLILNPNSKETDLLDSVSLGFGFVVSERLKILLREFILPPHRFYPMDVIGSAINYFWFHYITEIEKYIDYAKTEIEVYKSRAPFNVEEIKTFSSQIEIMNFKRALPYNKAIKFKSIQLKENFPNYDIFEITGAQYFTLISERLRDKLIRENITGLEIVEYKKIVVHKT